MSCRNHLLCISISFWVFTVLQLLISFSFCLPNNFPTCLLVVETVTALTRQEGQQLRCRDCGNQQQQDELGVRDGDYGWGKRLEMWTQLQVQRLHLWPLITWGT
eukprot:Gb_17345 [translate_table: standard]